MDEGGSRNPFLRLFSKKKTDDEQMEQEIISMVDEAHEQGAPVSYTHLTLPTTSRV